MVRRGANLLALALALVGLAVAPAASAQDLLYAAQAPSGFRRLGTSGLERIPDFDGDGLDDLLATYTGASGNPLAAATIRSAADGHELAAMVVDVAKRELVDATLCGDLDGDGRADVLAGDAHFMRAGDTVFRGRVLVFSSGTLALLYTVEGPDPPLGRATSFGYSMAALDDIDGDGVRDWLVAAPSYGPNGNGRAWIHSGASGAQLRLHDGKTLGLKALGTALAGTGDLDGDGVRDYALSATTGAGRIGLYSGHTGAELRVVAASPGDTAFGTVLSATGDFDHDGFDDLLATSHGTAGNGAVTLVSGRDGSSLLVLAGDRPDIDFGHSMAAVGDVSGDGVDDFLVGAPSFPDTGSNRGLVRLFSGRDGHELWRQVGTQDSSSLGRNVTGGIDVDGDGRPELVWSDGEKGERLAVVAGSDLFLTATPPDPAPLATETLEMSGGQPGALALLVVVDISGTPMFSTIAITLLDPAGDFAESLVVPPDASGEVFTLLAFAQKSARGGSVDSRRAIVAVE